MAVPKLQAVRSVWCSMPSGCGQVLTRIHAEPSKGRVHGAWAAMPRPIGPPSLPVIAPTRLPRQQISTVRRRSSGFKGMGFIISGLKVMRPMGLTGARPVQLTDLGGNPRIRTACCGAQERPRPKSGICGRKDWPSLDLPRSGRAGRRNLTLHNILKIAAGLGIDAGELVSGLSTPASQ